MGLVTLWPAVLAFFVFPVFALQWFIFAWRAMPTDETPPAWFLLIFALPFATMLLTVGLLIVYVVDVFKNDRIAPDKKLLWAVALFMGGIIAMPVYWYLYFWRDAK